MSTDKPKPIAIIGINLKFPGDAVSPQLFWDLILSARNVSREIPADRFNIDGEDESNSWKNRLQYQMWTKLSLSILSSGSE